MSARIGSLCSGYGGLDMAVMDAVPGATVAWHAQYDPDDKHQYAARILAHRWPGVPNLGDITRADWFEAEPVDILTAGYPCQPISYAGKGLVTEDARWIWPAVAQCIRLLRPALVYLENVAAHLLRGFTTVVSDLARLGYVGSWIRLRASDVGAPHQRERLFILAAAAENADQQPRFQWWVAASGQEEGGRARADAGRRGGAPAADAGRYARPEDNSHLTATAGSGSDAAWGRYAPAIRRWEAVLGRPAPAPVDGRGRLAPSFAEWMMGPPAGWVTDVPGIPRSAQLKALGNGVVPQQGAAAFRILSGRLAHLERAR